MILDGAITVSSRADYFHLILCEHDRTVSCPAITFEQELDNPDNGTTKLTKRRVRCASYNITAIPGVDDPATWDNVQRQFRHRIL
eukprot:scaffold1052_cov50-Attheya_sp.AAC.2